MRLKSVKKRIFTKAFLAETFCLGTYAYSSLVQLGRVVLWVDCALCGESAGWGYYGRAILERVTPPPAS